MSSTPQVTSTSPGGKDENVFPAKFLIVYACGALGAVILMLIAATVIAKLVKNVRHRNVPTQIPRSKPNNYTSVFISSVSTIPPEPAVAGPSEGFSTFREHAATNARTSSIETSSNLDRASYCRIKDVLQILPSLGSPARLRQLHEDVPRLGLPPVPQAPAPNSPLLALRDVPRGDDSGSDEPMLEDPALLGAMAAETTPDSPRSNNSYLALFSDEEHSAMIAEYVANQQLASATPTLRRTGKKPIPEPRIHTRRLHQYANTSMLRRLNRRLSRIFGRDHIDHLAEQSGMVKMPVPARRTLRGTHNAAPAGQTRETQVSHRSPVTPRLPRGTRDRATIDVVNESSLYDSPVSVRKERLGEGTRDGFLSAEELEISLEEAKTPIARSRSQRHGDDTMVYTCMSTPRAVSNY